MKYSIEIEIPRARSKVIELFSDRDNMKAWQPSLVSFERINGDRDAQGATSKLKHKMGRREVEMLETLTSYNMPDECAATYEAGGVWNLVENRFEAADENRTKWTVTSEFRCKGMMRIMALLMPGMFKKQTRMYMEQFRDFVEKQG